MRSPKSSSYLEYKSSKVKYIGRIPSGWSTVPVKRVANIFNGATPKSSEMRYWDGDVSWITPADLGKKGRSQISRGKRNISLEGYDSCGASMVPEGAIILSTRAPIGTLGIAANPLCTNQGCKSLVTKKDYNSKYLYYQFLCTTEQLNVLGKGTTFLELSSSDLGSFDICNPSKDEQQQIANFLDHETAKMDRLIEKQEQLIALLKEKRQAVISHAVTKGLNPNAPMRDSGVPWLGKVPVHWEVCKIKNVVYGIIDGPHFSPNYNDEGILFISARNIKKDSWSFSDAKYISEKDFEEFNKRVRPEKGDVLLTKGGTTGIARAVDFDFPFQVWVHVAVLKTNRTKINPFFLAYTLNGTSCYEQSQLFTRGATNNDLGLSRIAKIIFSIPSLLEQQKIVTHLDNKTFTLDLTISKANLCIELLKERRTALISAAVTGKIDVRNWQPPNNVSNPTTEEPHE